VYSILNSTKLLIDNMGIFALGKLIIIAGVVERDMMLSEMIDPSFVDKKGLGMLLFCVPKKPCKMSCTVHHERQSAPIKIQNSSI
jgi:hypothetical protein